MTLAGQLKLNCDPFARDGVSPLGPVRAALEQLMRHVELGTAIILVVGPAGSGKSFLLGLAEESGRARGLSVLRIERGDLARGRAIVQRRGGDVHRRRPRRRF